MTARRLEAFVRRVAAVPEPAMRIVLWRERIDQAEPQVVVDTLQHLLSRLKKGREGAQTAYLALVQHLAARGSDAQVRAILAIADDDQIRGLFVTGAPHRAASDTELQAPPLSKDREITLGERRSWARRTDRNLLTRMLFDRDPRVIATLLQNPRIIERDVLRIASRRPADAGVLRILFQHPRWSRQRSVQLALISNPYTPIEVSCGLIALLDRETVQSLSREPSLHPEVQAAATRRLKL